MNVFAPQQLKIQMDLVFSQEELNKMDSLKLGGFNFFKGEIAEDYVTYTCS